MSSPFTKEELGAFFKENVSRVLSFWKEHGGTLGETVENMLSSHKMFSPMIAPKESVFSGTGKFVVLDNTNTDIWEYIKDATNILFVKPVQSGKTSDVLKVVEHLYKTHIIIFVSDKNAALAGQTNERSKIIGYSVKDFRDIGNLGEAYKYMLSNSNDTLSGKGRRRIAHFLMEINNVQMLIQLLTIIPDNIPIALIIDEGDKNRNVDGEATSFIDEDDDTDDSEVKLPPITAGLLTCKNILHDKKNGSKTIYVTATPQGVMCSEKDDDRLVVYKKPYDNYTGVGLEHKHNLDIVKSMLNNNCKARDRWTGDDRWSNSWYSGVIQAIEKFETLGTKDDSIKQLMLISLENRNVVQGRLAAVCRSLITRENDNNIGIIVFNGINKDKMNPLLSDRIKACPQKKIIIVAGFMAARGVSFTDFSMPDNKFELVIQVHAAKKTDPLNSSMQAMRIYGPARRTVSKAILFCNQITWEDNTYNFLEAYRVCKELAEGKRTVYQNRYNPERPLTQKSNLRYMKQGFSDNILLFESYDPADHEPVRTM